MKKFLTVLLGMISIACAICALVGCGTPAYYKLTYENIEGVTFDFNGIESGAEVKDGYTVVFTAEFSDQLQGKDDAQVKVNGQTLTKNADGTYSFVMKEDSNVTVGGVSTSGSYKVSFLKIFTGADNTLVENRLNYLDLDGNELDNLNVESGTEIKFTIDISVYYDVDKENPYTVLANDMVLIGEEIGGKTVYSISPIRDTNITVTGLELKKNFGQREDGDGSYENPYRIREAMDLYLLADIVNDSYYGGLYNGAYYSLENDIDMKGEQLYIIGDGTTETAYFSGTFLGNGHKISNFVLEDTLIEQSGFTDVFVKYIGLFGRTSPNLERTKTGEISLTPCVIKDLNLENYEIVVDAAKYRSGFYAGGLIGYAMGTEISGCTASGKITVDADSSEGGYAGGLVGFDQAYYADEQYKHVSQISGCMSNVAINGRSGRLFAAGGIVGAMSGMSETAPAMVINSAASGSINGAIYAGGLVGFLDSFASLQKSYCSASSVSAYNRTSFVAGSTADSLSSYAGGVAGYVYSDSIVKDCFSVATVNANATAGASYAHRGDIVGGIRPADSGRVESVAGLALNNFAKNSGVDFTSAEALKNTLGFSEADWTFGGTYPVAKQGISAVKSVTLNVLEMNGANGNAASFTLNKYQPLSLWYASNGVEEYIAKNGELSYGYYLKDGENYYKAPAAYVPTGEELYVGFADYSQIAGVYYVKTSVQGSGTYIELKADGSLLYASGAAQNLSYYAYDGTYITLYGCPLFVTGGALYAGKATVDGNLIKMYDNQSYTQTATLNGVKKIEGLTYGKYYSGNQNLVLNSDGTAEYNGNSVTYMFNGTNLLINGIAATFGTDTVTVNGTTYTAYDAFEGVWETAASAHELYEFDGKNTWKYTSFEYEKVGGTNSVKEVSTSNGTYTVAGGVVTLYNGSNAVCGSAQFDENGYLQVTANSVQKTFYRENSNVGEWKMFYEESITLKFNGIGKDGYGTVTLSSTYLTQPMEMKYENVKQGENSYVRIFLDSDMYAQLGFDLQKLTLSGQIYSIKDGGALSNAAFCLYDNFRGEWLSTKFGIVTFDGFGAYSLSASQATGIAVEGTVIISGEYIPYTVDGTGFNGSFEYNGTTYSIVYSPANDTVTVTGGGDNFVMHHYDTWRNVKLSDNGGNVYAFNGYGLLSGGGKATVTNGANTTECGYTVSADGNTVTLTSGETIVKNANGYVLKKSGSPDASLKIVNVFTGSWTIGGLGGSITVGEVGSDSTASGTYCGENVTFVYESENLMSFKYGGKTLYLIKLSIVTGKQQEIALCQAPSTRYGFTRCIKAGALDKFAGEYVAEDGQKIVLDGFIVSTVGSGKATVIGLEGKMTEYDYSENAFGVVELRLQGVVKYVLNPLSGKQDGAYALNGNWFELIKPDKFYKVHSNDAENEGVTYDFNGVGQIICSDGTVYSYTTIPEPDVDKLVFVFTLTDAQGNTYTAEMSYGTSEYPMTITKN